MHLGNEFFPYQNCEDSESATEKKKNMPFDYIYVMVSQLLSLNLSKKILL